MGVPSVRFAVTIDLQEFVRSNAPADGGDGFVIIQPNEGRFVTQS
jgi:hypothetical protein